MRDRARIVVGSMGLTAALLFGSGLAAIAEPFPVDPAPTQTGGPGDAGGAGGPNLPESAPAAPTHSAPGVPDSASPEREPAPAESDPAAPGASDPTDEACPDAVPLIPSWKTDVTVGMVGDGAVATVNEQITIVAAAPGESLNLTHTIHLAPLPGSNAETRIAEVSAVAVVGGQERPATVDVRFEPITADGYQPVDFVLRAPDAADAQELTYTLTYTIVDPLIPLVDDPDRIVMAFTIGAISHPHPIEHYAADFTIEPPLSDALAEGEVGCAVMRADGTKDACVLDGTNAGFSIVSSSPLGRDEYVKFEAVFDLAALPDALEEHERRDRSEAEAGGPALDAPEWTRTAALVGLAALGTAGFVVSFRRNRATD